MYLRNNIVLDSLDDVYFSPSLFSIKIECVCMHNFFESICLLCVLILLRVLMNIGNWVFPQKIWTSLNRIQTSASTLDEIKKWKKNKILFSLRWIVILDCSFLYTIFLFAFLDICCFALCIYSNFSYRKLSEQYKMKIWNLEKLKR